MEKMRNYKILSVVSLCIAIIGIGIGFANYASLLTISSGSSVSTTGGNFKVVFSSKSDELSVSDVTPSRSSEDFTATSASINNNDTNGPLISNIGATFTQPGQSVTYTFYARNEGEYTAFLNKITADATKTCTAVNGTTEEVKNKLCQGMSLAVTVADESVTTNTNVSGHSLPVGEDEEIVVTISYNPTEALVGDIEVTFSDITLEYNGVD